MKIKDQVYSWYIKNVLLPGIEKIDNPGFIVTQFSDKGSITYLREVMLPEDLFANVEKEFVSKYGKEAEQALYSSGKKFGYVYSSISEFPQFMDDRKKDFDNFVYSLTRYVETLFANKIEHEIDYANKTIKFSLDRYIICEKNGLGFLWGAGGIAGIWAWLMASKDIEGLQVTCQGRGDKICEIICGPYEILKSKGMMTQRENNLESFSFKSVYRDINSVMPSRYSKVSLKTLIDNSFFKYNRGQVTFGKERYFSSEAHIIYLLESELSKLTGGSELLFVTAFEYGKSLANSGVCRDQNYEKFIMDYLSALGWGDVLMIKKSGKYQTIVSYFPWTEYAKDSKFVLFSGLISGLLSGFFKKQISLSLNSVDTKTGHLTVVLSE